MSELELSPEQRAIIEMRNRALLVSAGAGSGKTWVLIRRLMGMVNPPVDPKINRVEIDKFLIITFTKAAAGELRTRISEQLSEAAQKEAAAGQKDRAMFLKKQKALASSAHIGTIHSFCSTVLKEYGSKVGLRPGFKVIEAERADSMKETVLNRVLEQRYSEADSYPGFIELADTLGSGRDDGKLVKLIFSLYGKMQCHARPELWARKQKQALEGDFEDLSETIWGAEIMNYHREKMLYCAKKAEELAEELTLSDDPAINKNAVIIDTVADAASQLAHSLDIQNGGSWAAAAALPPVKIPNLKPMTKAEDECFAKYIKKEKNSLTSLLSEAVKEFDNDTEQLKANLMKTAPAVRALLDVILDFGEEYRREKRENSLVDFSDLEHYAVELLTEPDGSPTAVAKEISKRFVEIMVDEYQDVSPVQDAIFRAVSRNGENLFFVGDIKQSIYRFRLADPGIFREKRDTYADWTAPGGGPVKVPLRKNFRSRQSIVNAVNSVFSACMSNTLGDVDYSRPEEQMIYGSSYVGEAPMPELILIQPPNKKENADAPDKTYLEAKAVADKLKKLIADKTPVSADKDNQTQRPMEYSDVAILMRSAGREEPVFRAVFAEEGIPVNSGAEAGFFSAPEITALISLLSVTDNPHKDIPLIAALSSPCFGFTADELAAIRATKPKADLYDALCAAAESDAHCGEFLAFLNSLRENAAYMTVTELVWHIVCSTDMLALCSATTRGELRRERILKFVELSQRFEDSSYRGLHQFNVWIRRLRDKNTNPPISTTAEGGVTIMTVHKSKGLEFPVVFLCNTAKQFNHEDRSAEVLFHPELGLASRCVDTELGAYCSTFARTAIGYRLKSETLSEEMRLLYVALTRAREQLYITGHTDKLEKIQAEAELIRYAGSLEPEELAEAKSSLEWLTAAAALDDGRNLKVTVIDANSCLSPDAEPETALQPENSRETYNELERELEENLAFVYPYQNAGGLPSKLTATEIKDMTQRDDEAQELIRPADTGAPRQLPMPDFTAAERPLTAAERGVAVHAVLQYLDFSKTGSIEELDGEIQRISQGGFITPAQADAVDRQALLKLFESETGRLLKGPGRVRREFRFSLLFDARQLINTGGDEQILLQGVVDCLVEEPDGITVIDYKTDRVYTPEDTAARAEHYSPQVNAYRRAMERVFSKPVKQCILYFPVPGIAVEISEDN